MDFDHAESSLLATVHVAMPQGFAVPALHCKGLPDFGVTPVEARQAYNRLRQRYFVVKVGSYIQLTGQGTTLFADLDEMFRDICHD